MGDDVKCNIRIINIDGDEKYEALSYVWGERRMEDEIQVISHRIAVTKNLYRALQRLRYPKKKRTVWIDQLCIDQSDNLEKARQVAMMGDIYRRCTCCIIWLGELDEHANTFSPQAAAAVFDFIKKVAAVANAPVQTLPTLFEPTWEGEAARKAFAAFAMYGNPWWSRIWTVQEAIIPSSAIFVWGHLSVSRDDMFSTSRYLRRNVIYDYFSEEFIEWRAHYSELIRRMVYPVHGFIHSSTHDGPLDLLMRWRHRRSTDPRDKVYALMGLMPENALPSASNYDYEAPPSQLFANVTFDLVQTEKGLRSLVATSELPHQTTDLPSWAIDFAHSNHVGHRQLKWWNHSHRYREFSTSGAETLQASLLQNGEILALTGLLVDEIEETGHVYEVLDHESVTMHLLCESIESYKKLVDLWKSSNGDPRDYITGETWNAAVSRTLIGDLIMAEYPRERANPSHETYLDDPRKALENQTRGSVYESISGMIPNQTFFITKKGYVGMGPPNAKYGDQVWVLYGGQVPFILRKTEKDSIVEKTHKLKLVGNAYVHGIMDGQATQDGHEAQTVWLF